MMRAVKPQLMLIILALMLALALAVILGSPFAPVAAPCPEDIETIWAIEDARTPCDGPLVTALENNGVPLAYDRETNTFYCSLGLDKGEQWPQIHLTAPGAEGVSLLFADDFTYDSCAEAVAMSNVYSLLAYTQEEYAYANLVFTGLPLLSLTAEGEITREDTPAYVEIGAYGQQAVRTNARVHKRGGLSGGSEKAGYRVEYTRGMGTGGKTVQLTPGIGQTDTLLLLPMPYDRSLMRDRLSWALYGEMKGGDGRFGARPTAYAEVFVNDRYMGVYLMMQPFDVEAELTDGGNAVTDSIYRTCVTYLVHDDPVSEHPFREQSGYRLFYTPDERRPFAALDTYLGLLQEQDDEAFCQKALAHIDLEDMLRTLLLIQAGGMTDNVFNNLYIWAEQTPSGTVYHFLPWDMDLSWGMKMEDIGQQYEYWMCFPTADRLLNLNPGGRIRSALEQMWTQLRADVFSEAHIEALLAQYAHELNASGAMLRNAERWGTEDYAADGSGIAEFAGIRFALLDETIERLSEPDAPRALFLERTQWQDKGNPIEWADGGEAVPSAEK